MAWPQDKKTLDILTGIMRRMPMDRMQLKWLPGEPDFADGNEDCLVITQEGFYADINSSHPYPYMCTEAR
ncbi:unnamed protein product [Colias eurytheme]|nr:unnamed protein product [Colias eurytheme]